MNEDKDKAAKADEEKIPPQPDKWKNTTAYVHWLLLYHWKGAPLKKKK